MLLRALVVWFGLLAAAIANGAVREALILPRTGELAAHAISTITLSAAILAISWLAVPWIDPASAARALQVGGVWVALTVGFEFLAGHYLFGASWERLLADYNLLGGRIWVIVLLTTLVAPLASARGHELFG
jgi:hypothetical protein